MTRPYLGADPGGEAMLVKRLRFRSLFVVVAAVCGLTLEATALPLIAVAAVAGNIDDCQNGTTATKPCNSTDPGDWANGNLTATKAKYFEGDSVPFRLEGTGLNASLATHTMVFSWDTTKSGKHAFDYITTYTRTVTTADACAGQPFACGNPMTFPIPADPHVTAAGVTPVPGNLTMYNGTITGISAYSLSGSYAADSTTQITVSFTTTSPNVVLAWGEHVATRADWGLSGSAVSISGSPYHVHLVSVDGGGGSQDHQMQSAVVVLPASLTVVKDAQPDSTQAFPFTASGGLTPASFSLTDNGGTPGCGTNTNTQCFPKIGDFTTTFAISEGATPGWMLSGISFTVTSPNGGSRTVSGSTANIKFGQGEFVTATFTNKINAPSFSVTKTAGTAVSTPGGTVNYTLKVTNTGGPGVATVTDTYAPATVATAPAGCTNNTITSTLVCTTASIPMSGSVTITYTATMPSTFTGTPASGCAPGTNQYPVVDNVTVTGGAAATATVCVAANPLFVVTKTSDTTTSVPGGTVSYTVTVTNAGHGPGSTSVTDTYAPATLQSVPLGCTNNSPTAGTLTCPSGILQPGQSTSFSYKATMPTTFTGMPGSGCTPGTNQFPVVDTVTVNGGSSATVTVCVTANPQFTVNKVASTALTTPGSQISYTVTVKNIGTGPGATSVTDTYAPATLVAVPASCKDSTPAAGTMTCQAPSLAPSASYSFDYAATMPSTFSGTPASGCTPGTAQYPVVDTVTVNGGSSATVTVCVTANPQFTVNKVASTPTSSPGSAVSYTVTVKNIGAGPGATSVTDTYAPATLSSIPAQCQDSTPAAGTMTCTTPVLAPNASFSFDYMATMPTSFSGTPGTDCTPGTNQFPVVDTVTVNGGATSQVKVCVTANPAFSVSKSANPTITTPGGTVTYTVTVNNTGAGPGATSVTDTYAAATLVTFPASCQNNTPAGVLTCTTGTLAARTGSQSFVYTATMPTTFTGTPASGCTPGTTQYPVIDTVAVNGGATDTATVCVPANPKFTVAKVANTATSTPGGTVSYTVTVQNTGAGPGATSVTDTYAPASLVTVPANCQDDTPTAGTMTCTTPILQPGASLSFDYAVTMPTSFSGTPGTDCTPGTNQFPVVDTVTVNGGASSQVKVCVTANPQFTVAKSASPTSTTPGATVTYTVTVNNTGAGPGATSVTDTYTPATLVTFPSSCQNNTPATGVLTCTTGTLAARTGTQSFVYTATMPTTFTGTPNTNNCTGTNQFAVVDTVLVNGGATATATECVTANPNLTIAKAADKTSVTTGDLLTYTLTYANSGAGPASGVVITDPVPGTTAETACSNSCTTPGGVATWNIGALPAGSGGSVTMTVQVQANVGCQIANTASIASPTQNAGAPVSSNTVFVNGVPGPNPGGAHASGSAVAASATVALLGINAAFAPSASSVSGVGLQSNNATVLSASVTALGLPVLATNVLTTASTSQVTASPAEAKDTTSAEVANVNLLGGVVTADTVRAVASTSANGGASSFSAAGSTIVNLKVSGVAITDITPNLIIPLPALTFGSGSYVAVFGQNGTTSGPAAGQLSGGTYAASLSVDMIRVHVTSLALLVGTVDVTVGHAQSHADFPQTTICSTGGPAQSVSGHAFVAAEVTSPSILPLLFGYSSIPSQGGHGHSDVAAVSSMPLTAGVATSDALGTVSASSSNSKDTVTVANACVLLVRKGGCAISAGAVTSTSTTASNSSGSTSTDAGTQFLNLNVLGIAITGTVAPNTVITLPGIGFVILNEQVCDGGTLTNHTCTGATASGLTVRGIHVVVNKLGSGGLLPIGADVIVAEAHSDGRFGG